MLALARCLRVNTAGDARRAVWPLGAWSRALTSRSKQRLSRRIASHKGECLACCGVD